VAKRTCVGPECPHESMPNGDVCKSHWTQRKRHPDRPLQKLRRYSPKGGFIICAFPDCGRRVVSGDDCAGHRQQRVEGKTLTPLKKIAAKGADQGDCPCGRKAKITGLCKICYHSKYQSHWQTNNKEKVLSYVHQRRQRVENAADGTNLSSVMAFMRNSPCVVCGTTSRIEIDHIVPLARGGLHSASNLQPLCRSCNAQKNSKTMEEWLGVSV